MKFSKIIGKIDPKLVQEAEDKLSSVFLELGTRYDNDHVGSRLGGDPLIFSLMFPVEHVCTLNMPTAATDGKRYYWNPKFVIKQHKIGLRIICTHEAFHAIYMHPQRRGARIPRLWNIAVDYIVNGAAMEDLKARKKDPSEMFKKYLGNFMTLEQYAEMIKNPFATPKGLEGVKPDLENDSSPKVNLPSPDEDRELTEEEKKELEAREKKVLCFYADPDLSEDMKSPENIYNYLYGLLPKCPKCGKVGMYKKPKKDNDKSNQNPDDQDDKSDQKDKDKNGDKDKNQGSDDSQSGCGDDKSDHKCDKDCKHEHGSGCDECDDSIDIFDLGGTLDEHMDTEENEEKLAKRIADAMESAKKMAGYVPGALEDELGKLTAPKVTWQDVVRAKLIKARSGHNRNDWTKFKTRPMFCGMLTPKRKSYFANFICLLDTSGSMSKDDMSFGISQLQSLDERAEGTIVPADAEIYWDQATKIKVTKAEELSKVKVFGRGGTCFNSFFSDYEKKIGKADFLIVITDGYLMDTDIAEMKNPGIETIWLITSGAQFKPPFGRCFDLRSM